MLKLMRNRCFEKSGRVPSRGVFVPIIIYSRSALKTESENIYVDYDSSGHVYDTTVSYSCYGRRKSNFFNKYS